MAENMNAGYGSIVANALQKSTAGKTFFVTGAIGTGINGQRLQDLFPVDNDGVVRVHATIASALAATVAGRGDVIIIAEDFTTAITDAQLSTAGTNNVKVIYADQIGKDEILVNTASKTLPASTTGTLFTVTGLCEVISIIGTVTTIIEAGANNLKLSTVSNSASTDICANLDIDGDLAQSRMSITGTFGNAMINTAKGVPVARQATSFAVQEGTIIATTSATKTGAIRWSVLYRPLQAGSRIVAA